MESPPSQALPPQPKPCPWYLCALGYVAAVAATLAILVAGMRLDLLSYDDYKAPFTYKHDALLILPFVKATVERGSHWRNERLGAPGIQELHDFPVIDHLHFAVIWLIGKAVKDPVIAFNVFYLLTYPLTTLTGMFANRRLGLSVPAAGAGAILYAFQPYHYMREEVHYFLSAYYIVPLTLLITLRICQGRLPFFPQRADGLRRFRLKDGLGWWGVVVAVLTACAGAYYAFFACALLAAAGVYGWFVTGTWRSMMSAILMVGVIGIAGVVNHLPTIAYQYSNGQNNRPTVRYSEEAEVYGMKVAQLVLPVGGHNWLPLARVRSEYDAIQRRPSQNENEWGAFGIIGATGFVALIILAFVPRRLGWPLGALSAMTLFATLLGTVGGVGAVFNHLVTPQVRAVNRISIYIAFLALFAVFWAVEHYIMTRRGRTRFLLWPACIALVSLGLWDQLNNTWFRTADEGIAKERAKVAKQFWADRKFFQRMEQILAESADRIPPEYRDEPPAVFNYPYQYYPEAHPIRDAVFSYDHVRGYLHTDKVRWSFGAMSGREWDIRFRSLVDVPPDRLVDRLVAMGFRGLLVDTRAFTPKEFEELDSQLVNILGTSVPRIMHPGNYAFYDLTLFTEFLIRTSPARYVEMRRAERDGLTALFLRGFVVYELGGRESKKVDCQPKAEMFLSNPTDVPRAVRIEMELSIPLPLVNKQGVTRKPIPLTISGGTVWNETIDNLGDIPQKTSREIVVPPGRHRVIFRCQPPSDYLPADSRLTFLVISNFKLEEVPMP